MSVIDVYSMDPFGNEMIMFRLDGHELKSLLKEAYSFDEYLPIYPSGMKSKYLLDEEGEVVEIELFSEIGEDFDLNKVYNVVMNSYMASVYMSDSRDPGESLFLLTAESTIEYLKELKQIPSYRDERRVEIVH